MVSETEKLAVPAALRKRLKIFRSGEGEEQSVFIRDEVLAENHKLEVWQFFVLEVLFGCETFEQLSSVFEDRFGKPLTVGELDELFALVTTRKWFSIPAIIHPLVVASHKRAEGLDTASAPQRTSGKPDQPSVTANGDVLPPGVQDALGMDESSKKKIWKLFDPRGLLKLIYPLLAPFQYVIYVLPLLLLAAGGILFKYSADVAAALDTRHQDVPLLKHLLISMVTDNLLATLGTCLVAYRFRATVNAFGIVLHLWVLPRFIARIGHVRQLSRRERIWLHATPLLVRLTLLCSGVLVWFGFSDSHPLLSSLGLTLMTASFISLAITGNPLIKSNAYHLISAYVNEPYLRGKSSRALLDKFRGKTYQKADGDVLAAYALASAVFMLLAIGVVLYFADRILQFHLGGPSVLLVAALAAIIAWVLIAKLKRLDKFYSRANQFEQWRERAIPERKPGDEQKPKATSAGAFAFRATFLILIGALFLPYTRELGAPFTVHAEQRQEITSALGGIVDELHFDGGEFLEAGTVIGRLSYAEDEVQAALLEAKIAEQEAVIAELLSRPRLEEVQLAESKLETAATRVRLSAEKLARLELLHEATAPEVQLAERKVRLAEDQVQLGERNLITEETRARFSAEQFERMQGLHAQNAVSFEDLEDARQESEVDAARVEEQRANIGVMRTNIEVMLADVALMKSKAFDELEAMRQEHELNLERVGEERANLELAKLGAKAEELSSAEAKLQGWKDELAYYQERIGQSVYSMPIGGTLVATRLKERKGSYIEKGGLLAVVENTEQVLLQLDVQEPDVGKVSKGDSVRARLPAYFDEDLEGLVTGIDSTVTELSAGTVVRVTVALDNRDGRLKTGMTGYAKIRSEELPLWQVLSPGLVRFFKVEVWSWLP